MIESSFINYLHNNLTKNKNILQKLIDTQGFTLETIEKFKIGLDLNTKRITIPIDYEGEYVGLKLYSPKKKPKYYAYKNPKTNVSYNKKMLWGKETIKDANIVLICAGEKDRIIAIQNGFTAVTSTTGENTWDSEWNDYFKNKAVAIVYDNDATGRKASLKVACELSSICTFRVIDLGDHLKEEGEDLQDYFFKYKNTSEDLLNVIGQTKPYFKEEVLEPLENYEYAQKILTENIMHYDDDKGFFIYYPHGIWKFIEKETDINYIILNSIKKHEIPTTRKIRDTHSLLKIEAANKHSFKESSNLLNFKNGILDLNDFEITPHNSNKFLTHQLPITYNPNQDNSNCPLWLKFLNEVTCGNEELTLLIQQMFGYCLTDDISQQKAFLLLGKGSNGKSVLIKILETIIGEDNISNVSFSDLNKSFARSKLFNKLINTSTEIDFSSINNSSWFKAIVSGDKISAEMKHKPIFSFNPKTKLIYATNDLPAVKDKSFGYFRRLVIIPFNRTFDVDDQDKDLVNKLEKEIEGITNWALEGLKTLQELKILIEPSICKEILNKYKTETNSVLSFVKEECKLNENNEISKEKFIYEYKSYCLKNNNRPMSTVNVIGELTNNYGIIINNKKLCGIDIEFTEREF